MMSMVLFLVPFLSRMTEAVRQSLWNPIYFQTLLPITACVQSSRFVPLALVYGLRWLVVWLALIIYCPCNQ